MHSGERPHACNICQQSFSKLGTLRQHMVRHSGKRAFICEHCGDSFAQNSALYIHKRGKHKDKFKKGAQKATKPLRNTTTKELENNDADDPAALECDNQNTTNNSNISSDIKNVNEVSDANNESQPVFILQEYEEDSQQSDIKTEIESDATPIDDKAEVGTNESEYIDISDTGFSHDIKSEVKQEEVKLEVLTSEELDTKNNIHVDNHDVSKELKVDLDMNDSEELDDFIDPTKLEDFKPIQITEDLLDVDEDRTVVKNEVDIHFDPIFQP